MKRLVWLVVVVSLGCASTKTLPPRPQAGPGVHVMIWGKQPVQHIQPLFTAVYDMVRVCLGADFVPGPVFLSVADSLVVTQDDQEGSWLAYGISDRSIREATVEWGYLYNAEVLSHEFVHVLGQVDGHPPEPFKCTIPSGVELPDRYRPAGQ